MELNRGFLNQLSLKSAAGNFKRGGNELVSFSEDSPARAF